MALIKKGEAMPKSPVIIVIYGTPGSGKTTLANTSEEPILIDCDRGAKRSELRKDVITAKDWDEVLADESEIKKYKTCIIDTAKAVLDDYLMLYVIKKDIKLKTNKLKAYGAIGEEFKIFVNKRREELVSIVILAHSKEEKDGDKTKVSPDITGQSSALILRIADQVGFLSIENGQRVLSFEPTELVVGKNVANIEKLALPHFNSPSFSNYMSDIIQRVEQSIMEKDKSQQESLKEHESTKESIAKITTPKQANDVALTLKDSSEMTKKIFLPLLVQKTKDLGFKLNAEKKYELSNL